VRDILETLDQLAESVGLANRQPGASFKNPAGDEASLGRRRRQ
jgi:hypothetical protein